MSKVLILRHSFVRCHFIPTYSVKAMYRCKLCAAPVLDSKGRRQLSSSSLQYCAALLVDLACESGAANNDVTKECTSCRVSMQEVL